MYKGDYNFFDYKYNIIGYTGQDFGGIAQYLYLGISIILLTVLLIKLRKLNKSKVLRIIRYTSIFMIIFYLSKTTWESIYDIERDGVFNTGLLPLDTCSFIMYAGLISGFCKGKIKEYSDSWLATGCIVGGIANMVQLNAFNYYPFFTFGAFYSMIWHFIMVFIGTLLIVTKYVNIEYSTVIKGFIFHVILSIPIIIIDYIYNFDFMMYKELSSLPIFDGIGSNLISNELGFLNPLIMLILYFLTFNIVFGIPLLIKKLKKV